MGFGIQIRFPYQVTIYKVPFILITSFELGQDGLWPRKGIVMLAQLWGVVEETYYSEDYKIT